MSDIKLDAAIIQLLPIFQHQMSQFRLGAADVHAWSTIVEAAKNWQRIQDLPPGSSITHMKAEGPQPSTGMWRINYTHPKSGNYCIDTGDSPEDVLRKANL